MKTLMLLLSMLMETPSENVPDVELLDFTASYCQPCRLMVPILNRMETKGFPIRRIDITDEPDLSRQFRVEGVPTLVIMSEGKEVQRFVGLTSEEDLRAAMNKAARELAEKRKSNSRTKPDAAAAAQPGTPSAEERPEMEAGSSRQESPSIAGRSNGTLVDFFRRMYGSKGENAERPVIRGQSPKSGRLNGLALASAATVRVNVEGTTTRDGKEVILRETGTGTIISSEPGSTVILTCAHFFLGLKVGDTTTNIEVFQDGIPQTFPATVVGGDHGLDLALLKISPPGIFPSVALTSTAPAMQPDQLLTSFGCDGGDLPSQKTVMLIEENRYEGPGNLVCSTEPASGRSGGGLFDEQGILVGVCSCRNQEKSEGLYMAWTAINALMIKLKRTDLQRSEIADTDDTSSAHQPRTTPGNLKDNNSAETEIASEDGDRPFDPLDMDETYEFEPTPDSTEPIPSPPPRVSPSAVVASTGPEITVIIDDKTAGAQKKVIVIPRASPWLMEMLTGESNEKRTVAAMKAPRPTSALQPDPTVPPASKAEYQEQP